ncbi:hypothetical protein [Streptomyces scabiei]|uniref:hypothetical protein n=3 Tax=Streptomyces scabiei TaxID=1930 RepID=UPI0029B293F7|nr:hypothetical protein [Streptomyces scabiei]MDX2800128.1 hypothetical protein [Streptomyces scabiei]MDX3280148.1 hypothetical protein [Streptomyces scabiei]MDX3280160.1 hypothetical protein [Streptomyces scabiei]
MSGKRTARDVLLDFVSLAEAANDGTTPDQLVDDAISEALLNQPSMRTCLVPGCFRQYDAMVMAGRPPARPEWSCEGWRQVTRGPSPGSICPDHVDIVTTHLPRTIDLPNGKWTVHCACGWELVPQAWGGLLRPLWEQHLLTAAGTLPEPPAPRDSLERIPLAEHTEATLTELYDAFDDTEYDRVETRDAAQAMFKAWDWHRNALGGVSRVLTAVYNYMRISVGDTRDWTADRHDAYLWAVLVGFDDDILEEVAAKHRWNEHRVKYIDEMRTLLAPIAPIAPVADSRPKET